MRTPQTLLADPQAVLKLQAMQSDSYAPDRMERAKRAVLEIFSALKAAMPHRFSTMYPTLNDIAEAQTIWAIGIIEAKLSPKQITHGLTKVISSAKYCPDLPAFIEICKPVAEDFGLPSVKDAYEQACYNAHPGLQDRRWSHPAVFHAAQGVGSYELRTLDKDSSFPLFEDAYQKTVNAVMNGEALPEIPKALEDLGNKPKPMDWKPSDEDRAKGREALAGIQALFDRKRPQTKEGIAP